MALQLRKEGYNPILFHVVRLNNAYPRETRIANELRRELNMDYVELYLKVSGKNYHTETPIKNHFIMGAMIDYGIKYGITQYAQGTQLLDNTDIAILTLDYSDSSDIWIEQLGPMFKKSFDFKQHIFLKDDLDGFKIILEHNPELVNKISSCMSADMYLKNIQLANKKKFPNIKLGDNSCGSCNKCVIEYLLVSYLKNEEYDLNYVKKCMDVVRKNHKKQTGVLYKLDDYEPLLKRTSFFNPELEKKIIKKNYGKEM